VFSAGGQNLEPGNVDPNVAAGLAGQPSADTQSYRPGILLVPQASTYAVRA